MKLSLIVAVVVLALAQGSLAQDATSDLQRLSQYFEDLKNKMAQELSQLMNNQDLAGHAQNIHSQLQPVATKIQEHLRGVAANVEEQVKPMAEGVQTHIQPMVERFQEQVEAIFQNLAEKAKAIGN
uniref:type-4 ice-structuring protein-like n=1 Tax=Scatophagus argus TaxID=75038 RepID=UPI001ED7E434|nr:type-4 ice-structuring protein-like [Scatophagus argus]